MADKPDQTDRQRLQEGVHQTDLTESRINEDFVDWLKSAGPTWLLVILVGVTAYLGFVRFRQHKAQKNFDAWEALSTAALPGSKEDVADQHPDVFAVPQLALNAAGSQLLTSVQTDTPIDVAASTDPQAIEPAATPRLNEQERTENLDRADRIFARTIETDDGSLGMTLHIVPAIYGRAAVAESEGRLDEARAFYDQAAKRAEAFYPDLAEQARTRSITVGELDERVVFPTEGIKPRPFTAPYSSATKIPALRQLLAPPVDE